MSTVERSFTARARVARTDAESTSYCCAPAWAASGAAASRRAASLARGPTELRLHTRGGFGQRNLRRRRVAPMLVLDHAFLEAPVAHHDAMGNAHQLLVGEQHARALV